MIKKGDRADDIQWSDSGGVQYKLSDLYDRKAIAFSFYPKDFTTICTAQVCHIRDLYGDIQKAGGAIFGVSLDSGKLHAAFIRKYTLPFPLIVDRKKILSKRLGTLKWFGFLTSRATVVIRPDGLVLDVIHSERDANIHADRFIEILRTL